MKTVSQIISDKLNRLIAEEAALDSLFCQGGILPTKYRAQKAKMLAQADVLRAKGRNYQVVGV